MDPTETMRVVLDVSADNYDRDEAAGALAAWLQRGGFPPEGYTEAQTWKVLATFRAMMPTKRIQRVEATR